ncbi:OmpA family protein [Pelagerythrobacter marinus]|jgi:outer membrane protein OmpA-like peptidoglycan-associated protein|uniref:OmpA family protein n=1 Tax=Pelagerythrobacter marinus TaxID=538382 RepID=A0ABW9UYA2_9SPHN|nr:OmpA family protein [Pelagerythrobacter marinus]MEC9068372.1 OmpA family protein [Pseudomonadota bacterium]MXO68788.1 OmpA family protein [Pelagerythrobacter marinus]USA39096.1 OmpA family protein [Pelagerythrobacter marinus]WPZ06817.1 OmpA family protein [Pelagerythrobacter marinus]
MKKSKMIVASLAAMSLVSVSACVTDPNTGERKISRTAIGGVGGAAAGALLGGLIGGKTGRIIGAVGGGAIGGVVGYRMDQQIKELRESTAGSGIDVTEVDNGEAILVNLPDGVTFDVGSATLKPAFRSTLDDVAANLTQYPNSLIDVYGHTDSTGSESFNQGLSERRAQTVANYLTSRGVNSARIRWQGFGETMPVADNSTDYGRQRNRRVEIKIIPLTQAEIDAAQNR